MKLYRLFILLIIQSVFTLPGCSVFSFREYEGFWDWYVGRPGYLKVLHPELRANKVFDGITGERSPIYGHFRTFEILFQPAGGFEYPERETLKGHYREIGMPAMTEVADQMVWTIGRGYTDRRLEFDLVEAGALEIVPYRVYTSDEDLGFKALATAEQPIRTLLNVLFSAWSRVPIYVVHDTLKTMMIPYAAVYYATRSESRE
jgi:hypothetical protein